MPSATRKLGDSNGNEHNARVVPFCNTPPSASPAPLSFLTCQYAKIQSIPRAPLRSRMIYGPSGINRKPMLFLML